MLLLYQSCMVAFGVAGDQFRVANAEFGTRPDVGITPILFYISGAVAPLGFFAALISGFFIGEWWWPVLGTLLSAIIATIFRIKAPNYVSCLWAMFGTTAGLLSAVGILATL